MVTIETTTETIKALLVCAPKADARFYLNGIAIDMTRGIEPVLVATDGHRLLAARATYADGCEPGTGCVIIPRAALEAVKGKAPVRIEIDGETVTVRSATDTVCKAIDGRYPDWRRIVPTKANGETVQFDGAYLGDFRKIATLLGKRDSHITVHYNGEDHTLITFGHDGAIGVLMPLRTKGAFVIPRWVGVITAPADADNQADAA